MHPALSIAGQALPAWEIVTRLAQAAGAAVQYPNVRKLFEEMAAKVPEFAGASWGRETRPVQLRFAHSRG
jgi:predicted molibdopterin-dependent oxidoreductase YjgC